MCFSLKAQDIVTAIQKDSIVTVTQPDKLAEKVKKHHHTPSPENDVQKAEENDAPQHTAGFRILAFSDNNASTARNEAKERARLISEQLPQYRTYVTYESPYWRLKVGDFKSHDAAEQAATEIRHILPQYSREIRVVRDRINTK